MQRDHTPEEGRRHSHPSPTGAFAGHFPRCIRRAHRQCHAGHRACLAHSPRCTLGVPYTSGGLSDAVMRLVMQKLSERISQSMVVANRLGANGMIGSDNIAKSGSRRGDALSWKPVAAPTTGPASWRRSGTMAGYPGRFSESKHLIATLAIDHAF